MSSGCSLQLSVVCSVVQYGYCSCDEGTPASAGIREPAGFPNTFPGRPHSHSIYLTARPNNTVGCLFARHSLLRFYEKPCNPVRLSNERRAHGHERTERIEEIRSDSRQSFEKKKEKNASSKGHNQSKLVSVCTVATWGSGHKSTLLRRYSSTRDAHNPSPLPPPPPFFVYSHNSIYLCF